MSEQISVEFGTGNVFEDLGLPNAEERLFKSVIALRIRDICEERALNQTQAGQILGIDQPKVSALFKGRLHGFSLERLFRFMNLLGREIQIVEKVRTEGRAQTHVLLSGNDIRAPESSRSLTMV